MSHEARIKELGIFIPPAPAAAGNYLPALQVGKILHLSGVLCVQNGKMTHTGPAGKAHDVVSAAKGARVCALNALANIRAAAGSLDQVKRLISVTGFVNGVPGFPDSPAVINGASDLFVQVFGDAGRHTRVAVSVSGLPKDSTVEIQVVAELV
jgi:enamine deaminase RidA (YjgF/YER057c/UK114 family)